MVTATAERAALSDAALLLLKLFALAWMVGDHLDFYAFDGALRIHDGIGRIVFPVFAFVLAYNLTRAPVERLWTLAYRLALAGLVACLPYTLLQGALFPLNVMFTLALSVAVGAAWLQGRSALALGLFVIGGALVDYQWFGVLCVLLGWWSLREGGLCCEGRRCALALPALFAAILWPINGSWWALLAVPLVLAASTVQGPAPRLKWLFYAVYPVHLYALAAILFYT